MVHQENGKDKRTKNKVVLEKSMEIFIDQISKAGVFLWIFLERFKKAYARHPQSLPARLVGALINAVQNARLRVPQGPGNQSECDLMLLKQTMPFFREQDTCIWPIDGWFLWK